VANGELPGFSRDDQTLLAAFIGAHRRKLNRIAFQDLMVDEETALRLAILIRIAVLLNRHRSPRALPPVAAAGAKKSLSIAFPEDWLDEHPLTHADLEAEAKVLSACAPSPKGDGFGRRLKSAWSCRNSLFAYLETIVVLGHVTLKLYLLRYHLIRHIARRRHKVTTGPKVPTPELLADRPKVAHQTM